MLTHVGALCCSVMGAASPPPLHSGRLRRPWRPKFYEKARFRRFVKSVFLISTSPSYSAPSITPNSTISPRLPTHFHHFINFLMSSMSQLKIDHNFLFFWQTPCTEGVFSTQLDALYRSTCIRQQKHT
jgi:hypothetical protein